MERAFSALRRFILSNVNPALPFYEDAETAMPQVSDCDISFGTTDAMKGAGATLCSIWPESLDAGEGDIAGAALLEAQVTVTFFCRGAGYPEILRRACRYAACFRHELRRDWSLGGMASDSEIRSVRFYPDCGAAERQAAACEIEMTIALEEN